MCGVPWLEMAGEGAGEEPVGGQGSRGSCDWPALCHLLTRGRAFVGSLKELTWGAPMRTGVGSLRVESSCRSLVRCTENL